MRPSHVRTATIADLDALVQLETACFATDRLSRRRFRWMIQQAHASLLVSTSPESDAKLLGYLLLLFHRGTHLARVYSLAVDPAHQGQGIAQSLLLEAEQLALDEGCPVIRLEVRQDHPAAQRLYQKQGYRHFGDYSAYYEDQADAWRMQKYLWRPPRLSSHPVPYYAQTLPFTCGPACLIMAMAALNPRSDLDRRHELQVWREATSIFMTQGHGGCGPRGLALAAWNRGFGVDLWITPDGPLFIQGVRQAMKKQVLSLVHEAFCDALEATRVCQQSRAFDLSDLEAGLKKGGIPLVLISHWRFAKSKSPHWVVVTGIDEHFVFIHDPEIDEEALKSSIDVQQVPVARAVFDRMALFGHDRIRCALVLYTREKANV